MALLILSAGRNFDVLQRRNAALHSQGYEVFSPTASPQTVDQLLNGYFDLLLLDESIPDDDLRRLSAIVRNYTPSTPIMVISEHNQNECHLLAIAIDRYIQAGQRKMDMAC